MVRIVDCQFRTQAPLCCEKILLFSLIGRSVRSTLSYVLFHREEQLWEILVDVRKAESGILADISHKKGCGTGNV